MKFIPSVFILFILFLSSHTMTVYATSLKEMLDEVEAPSSKLSTREAEAPSSKRTMRSKAKTVPLAKTDTLQIDGDDPLAFLLSACSGSKKRGSATISSVTTGKAFYEPKKILTEDIMKILQEEEVILSGRMARLNEFKSSSVIRTIEELKLQKNVCAFFKSREKGKHDFQRLGKESTPKVILVEYDIYGGDKAILLDVVLKVAFVKVKQIKKSQQ